MIFFISLSFAITFKGSDSPVAFLKEPSALFAELRVLTHFASGVSSLINTFHFFSSPIVDFPVVRESL